jgi:hypothetical protein
MICCGIRSTRRLVTHGGFDSTSCISLYIVVEIGNRSQLVSDDSTLSYVERIGLLQVGIHIHIHIQDARVKRNPGIRTWISLNHFSTKTTVKATNDVIETTLC